MKKSLTFFKGDKVRLIDGRIGTVVARSTTNAYYYKIKTQDSNGKVIYLLSMNLDLRLIIRKKEKEISWIIKEVQK
jgi:hypothetical protein